MIKLRGSISRESALAGLVSAATAATLVLASTAFAGSPAPSASGPVRVATGAHQAVRLVLPPPTHVSVPAPVRAALETLIEIGFSKAIGLFGDTFWRDAVAESTIETYRQITGDTTYDYTFDNAALHINPRFFEDNLNDDTAWWGLALLQAYQITHERNYLNNAMTIARYIQETWNTNPMKCYGGGIPWQRSGPNFNYTGAIQNGLFLELTAWLHNTIVEDHGSDSGPNSFLSWAMREWKYFQRTRDFHTNAIPRPTKRGFAGPSILEPYWVPDGSPVSQNLPAQNFLCGSGRYRIYTYNQGVMLAGLVQLYKATNSLAYLTDAEDIANAVLKPPTPTETALALAAAPARRSPWIFTLFGVLVEPQDPLFSTTQGLGDGAAFKGIFVRDLRMLYDAIASTPNKKADQCTATYKNKTYNQCTTMYKDFFTTQVCSIEANDTLNADEDFISPDGLSPQPAVLLGDRWQGPNTPHDITTQVSAIEAFAAALSLPGQSPPSFPNCKPGHRSPGERGQQGQQGLPSHARQAVERCAGGWHRMPGCREDHDFGRFFHERHKQFSREDDQGQDD